MSLSKFCLLSVLYKFASTSSLIKFFRRRYEHQLVRDLNHVLGLKSKCVRWKEELRFLKGCLEQHVAPSTIKSRVRKGKPKKPHDIERAFIRDEIDKFVELLELNTAEYHRKCVASCKRLSFFDRIRFCKLLNKTAGRLLYQTRTKKEKTLRLLIRTQLGLGQLDHSTITNLSSVELTEVQKNVLCRGLNFGVLPKVSKEEVKAEFELGWNQVKDLPAVSEERREECRSTLSSLAHRYANSKVDTSGFPLGKDHLAALRELRANQDIVISKPDKGNGVVILDKEDYVAKMTEILSQEDKFKCIGEVEDHDNTILRERALQAFLLNKRKAGFISQEVYERIRPVGSTRPRMYGLPKIHKPGVPVRPILSMTNAPQHELAKWLAELLRPVVQKFSEHTVKDTFDFCSNIDGFTDIDIGNAYMCSFDVTSLFTNIPLRETLDVCLDTLYRDDDIVKPTIPENVLEKLLLKATTDVEFSFNGTMYKQVDGVAMGSPLGPVLANIFVGFCEAQIDPAKWPPFYNRFVDDTFSVFLCKEESLAFFDVLNSLHPALKFTMEGESESKLPFMDVLVERAKDCFVRAVYRKPTFTGLYMRWDSFSPRYQKTNLIKSLTSRAVRICSASKLAGELSTLKDLFLKNGYPLYLVERSIKGVIERGRTTPSVEAENGSSFVCFRLPWLGNASMSVRREICAAVGRAFPTAQTRVFFNTRRAFPGRGKDVLPTTARSFVVYHYGCCCGQTYVGRTSQCLAERIKQHVPDKILLTQNLRMTKNDSAVLKHLKSSPECISQARSKFSILQQARSQAHLHVLEALFIAKFSPSLCSQKEFVHSLSLF